ncbi:hypothetical protein GCM10009647_069330 [Streptomyces sanglieri]
MVGVVEEEHQVTEADQRVGAVPGAGQRLGVAVHVADHVDTRALSGAVRSGSHGDHPRTLPVTWVEAAGPAKIFARSYGWTTVRPRITVVCDA